ESSRGFASLAAVTELRADESAVSSALRTAISERKTGRRPAYAEGRRRRATNEPPRNTRSRRALCTEPRETALSRGGVPSRSFTRQRLVKLEPRAGARASSACCSRSA